MASHTITDPEFAIHAQLAANTDDDVTFDHQLSTVTVFNRDGSAEIQVTTDGTSPNAGGAAKKKVIVPAAVGFVDISVETVGNTVVKLRSTGTPTFSVYCEPL